MGQGRLRGDHPRGRSGLWRWRGAHADAVAVSASCCRWPGSVIGRFSRGPWRGVMLLAEEGRARGCGWRGRCGVQRREGSARRAAAGDQGNLSLARGVTLFPLCLCFWPGQRMGSKGRDDGWVPFVSGVRRDEDALTSCGCGAAGDRGLAGPAHAWARASGGSARELGQAGWRGRPRGPFFPFSDSFKKFFYFVFSHFKICHAFVCEKHIAHTCVT
jgi:hypothetical protein